MKVTIPWLKRHLETNADLAEICETLTKIGLEVEGVEDAGQNLSGFRIAQIISAVQHPNADKLRLCMVDDGSGIPVQVVCGAHNARAGLRTVFAAPGTFIPASKTTLSIGEIRGVESRGMLCSAQELELSDVSDGIMDLPDNAPIGARYIDFAQIGGAVLDINLTPNRSDAAGVYGIARDLAASGLGKLKPVTTKSMSTTGACPLNIVIDLAPAERKLCPVFAMRLVKGIKNGPSPAWMQQFLKSVGLRPINALVDITNFLTFDLGRPLHVFDAAKIAGPLKVRHAYEGESLAALDGKTYILDKCAMVIADEKGVQSIAGIMGGELSGCDENTTEVLIECALWDPANIAQSGRKLGINSDARYRFERGVDPALTRVGLNIATQLVLDLCGGRASDVTQAGDVPGITKCVIFPWDEVKRLTGLELPIEDMAQILNQLGFVVAGEGKLATIEVPSWRPDVEGKADIVEEIIRIAGLEHVPNVPLKRLVNISEPLMTPMQRRTRKSRRALAANGMVEAITYSFISEAQAKAFGGGLAQLKLANPIAAELSDMRPSLLPGLIAASQRNADRANRDLALFEVGQVFFGLQPNDQKTAVSGMRRGLKLERNWQSGSRTVDMYDAKSDAFALLQALNIATESMQLVPGAPNWFHPGRSGTMQFGPKGVLGHFGELHPRVLEESGVTGKIVCFEIILDSLPIQKHKPTKTKPRLEISDYQSVTRDFAFIVDKSIRSDDVVKAARNTDRTLVSHLRLFDVYEGEHIETGKKSLGVEVTLQPQDKTLTETEIEAFTVKMVAEVFKKTGGILRG